MSDKAGDMTLDELFDECVSHDDDCECQFCKAFDVMWDAREALKRIDANERRGINGN